jgi:HEAT repeat-containing protein 5
MNKPIIGSYEHDTLVLCQAKQDGSFEPPPASTGVVDAAIELFSLLLPIQDLASTSRTVTQLVEAVRSPKLERNSGRKSAVLINAIYAMLLALRNATQSNSRHARETLGSSQVATALAEFLKV